MDYPAQRMVNRIGLLGQPWATGACIRAAWGLEVNSRSLLLFQTLTIFSIVSRSQFEALRGNPTSLQDTDRNVSSVIEAWLMEYVKLSHLIGKPKKCARIREYVISWFTTST